MNLRGKIIHKALKSIEAFDIDKNSHWNFCRYLDFKERVDTLKILSHVLFIRPRIKEMVNRRYRELATVEAITLELCKDTESYFIDVCFLEMGFRPYTDKDIETFDLDFSLYVPQIQELIRYQVQKEINFIESHTLELIF